MFKQITPKVLEVELIFLVFAYFNSEPGRYTLKQNFFFMCQFLWGIKQRTTDHNFYIVIKLFSSFEKQFEPPPQVFNELFLDILCRASGNAGNGANEEKDDELEEEWMLHSHYLKLP